MSTKTHMHSWMETEITGELNGWNDEDGGLNIQEGTGFP